MWLLLAGSAWFALPARPARQAPAGPATDQASDPADGTVSSPRRIPVRALQVVAALAALTGALAVLGPLRGLVAGCVLAPGAALAVTHLDTRVGRAPPRRELALCLDLVAAALRGGQPLPAALVLAAPAASEPTATELTRVARLLRLGADPIEAWHGVADDDVLAPVAQAACRSADSGIRLAHGLERVGEDVRAGIRAAAEARAQRAGILAMAPLGLCFLPAFVCLGVVPVVVGIAGKAFGGIP
jgi:Flp pilus assembly protein TadB